MKNWKFLLFSTVLVLFIYSCQDSNNEIINELSSRQNIENSQIPQYNFNLVDSFDIKEVHDQYSAEFCDSLNIWKSTIRDKYKIKHRTYEVFIIEKLSLTLGISQEEMRQLAVTWNMTESNFLDWAKLEREKFSGNILAFMEEIEPVMEEETDAQVIEKLENLRSKWIPLLGESYVNSVIDVAHSTFIYWRNNYTCILGNESVQIRKCPGCALAFSDLWGAGSGALFGGLAGAAVGAVYGTLGGSISLAFDW